MRRALLLAGLVLLAQCQTGVDSQEPCANLAADFARILEDSARANGVHGTQAAVLIPGRRTWLGVYGLNGSDDAMTSQLMIGTGSISKLYAVVAALRLVDRGVLSLDDTLGKWFSGVTNVGGSISLSQVMQHRSGIADYSAAPNYFQTVMADPNRSWRREELLPLIGLPLFPPGGGWNASNSNSLLLEIIVSRESGKPYGRFLHDEVWPGRTQSWLAGEGDPPGPLATQWATDQAGVLFDYSARYFGPALFTSRSEVQASAGNLVDFGQRLLGGDLLSRSSRDAMLTIVPDDGRIAGQTGGGLGIRRFNYLNRTLYGHSGGTPNSSALLLFDPPTGIVAAVSVNQGGPSHRQSHFRTTPALLQAALACGSR